MQTKEVYKYHFETGEYLGIEMAIESPMDPGEYIVPGGCTTVVPGENVSGKTQVFTGSAWEYVDDCRGTELIKKDKTDRITIREIGITLADYPDYTDVPIPDEKYKYYYDFIGGQWVLNIDRYKEDTCNRISWMCVNANYTMFPQYKRDNVYAGSPASDVYPVYLQGDSGKTSIAKLNSIYQGISNDNRNAINAVGITTIQQIDGIIASIVFPTEAEILARIQE